MWALDDKVPAFGLSMAVRGVQAQPERLGVALVAIMAQLVALIRR